MFPRPDGLLLGTALYVAVGAAALGAAWLLADALGGAVVADAADGGGAPVPLARMTQALSLRSIGGIHAIDWTDILRRTRLGLKVGARAKALLRTK